MNAKCLTRLVVGVVATAGLSGCVRASSGDEVDPGGRAEIPFDQTGEDQLAAWRHSLELLTRNGTIWWTSNAEHVEEDGIDAYAMRYEPIGPGLAARGCMWGERGGEIVGPFWEFFMGWDPQTGNGIAYQASPAGAIGNGYWVALDDGVTETDQTFRNPDGTTFRVRHEAEHPDEDTHVTRSFDRVGAQWEARRSYTWVRRVWDPPIRSGAELPC